MSDIKRYSDIKRERGRDSDTQRERLMYREKRDREETAKERETRR